MLTGDPFARFELERLFEPFAARRGLLIAVSGGPDSMALLRLAARWRSRNEGPQIHAATVDHGLREDSRREAEQTRCWTEAIGVSHTILTWAGEKPATRLQERARDARYALLANHAAALGVDTLMTAHHADDQAETILHRLTRGSGVVGLAGMAQEFQRGAILHARPLLEFGKDVLVGLCDALGQDYFRDPSNENPRFARARLRALGGRLAVEGLNRESLLRLGRRAARADAALSWATANLTRGLKIANEGDAPAIDINMFGQAPMEFLIRFLGARIQAIAGAWPRYDRLEALAGRLAQALETRTGCKATLGGARISLNASGILVMSRESPRRQHPPTQGK